MDVSRPIGSIVKSDRSVEPARNSPVGPARAEPAPETGSGAAPSGPTVEALRANLQESLRAANERLAERGTSVSMAVDRTTNTVIVQVKDRDTGDTVRQIPPETALRVARNIDRLTGILVDRTA